MLLTPSILGGWVGWLSFCRGMPPIAALPFVSRRSQLMMIFLHLNYRPDTGKEDGFHPLFLAPYLPLFGGPARGSAFRGTEISRAPNEPPKTHSGKRNGILRACFDQGRPHPTSRGCWGRIHTLPDHPRHRLASAGAPQRLRPNPDSPPLASQGRTANQDGTPALAKHKGQEGLRATVLAERKNNTPQAFGPGSIR